MATVATEAVELGRMGSSSLSWDDDQELKEAVCDAVLERMRRAVSGEGDFGVAIYGRAPSRELTSGFLVPRLNIDNDDVSSDISISLHGLDCRLNAAVPGFLKLVPRFNLYIRVLPTATEVFDPRLGLRPKPELSAAANQDKSKAIKDLTNGAAYKAMDRTAKSEARKRELAKFLRDRGITVGEKAIREAEAPAADGAANEGPNEEPNAIEILDANVRIPDQHAATHEVPEKYTRLTPQLPALELPLPWDARTWAALLAAYNHLLNEAVKAAFSDWMKSDDGKNWAWRKGRVPGSGFWSPEHWDAHLAKCRQADAKAKDLVPAMQIGAVVDVRPDPLAPHILTVRFGIENHKQGDVEVEEGIFQVGVELVLPAAALRSMPIERVRRSYHFSGFLSVPAIGVNGGVVHRQSGHLAILETTWCPRFVLPRMRPTSRANVPVQFEALRQPALSIAGLTSLPDAMLAWVQEVEGSPVMCEPGEEGTQADEDRQANRFRDDIKAWRAEALRIRRGVDVLSKSQAAYREDAASADAIPYRAWLLTNETFHRATTNPGWRLFQLGFILTHVPTLASRLPGFQETFNYEFDEGSASLLYMSTGGGKSEAFFGIVIYALFLDRLRGKRRGVTAMLHYPLRLLTLQQARRLMSLLAKAELLRHEERLQGAPFELGFWVGSGNTPNSIASGTSLLPEMRDIPLSSDDPFLADEDTFLTERQSYKAKNEAWNKLPQCPFCQARTGLRVYREEQHLLGIVCSSDECDWNGVHDTKKGRAPLPFLIVDTDIYRRAPSVLLGTVDKLALIGNHPTTINRIAGMFGMARFLVGHPDTGLLLTPAKSDQIAEAAKQGQPLAPAFEAGKELFVDPLPSLIVQDEMHLLEESLGTFGGLFETTLFAWFKEMAKLLGGRVPSVPGVPGAHRMPHVIGATATAADADRQMQHLYQRRAVQFPHPGPRLYASFYTELERFEAGGTAAATRGGRTTAREQEAMAPWARVYASLLTNGRSHTTATIEILANYAVGITRWSRDLTSDPLRQRRAADEIVENLSRGELSTRHAAAVLRASQNRRFDVLAQLVDLHRIMLTYVTNKKGGDQLMSALDRQVALQHELLGPDYRIARFDIELISGGVDIRGIQDVIAKAEKKRDPATEDVESSLRAIVATSAISHGVDVSAFNAMTFAGVPSDVAEYIQASSRVGRTHVGFSLLIPTPQTRRDRFVLDNHETFHRFLERMIAPPAIERWADKAIRRTLPSLIQTYLVGVMFQKEFLTAPDAKKASVVFPDGVLSLRDRLSQPRKAATEAGILGFLHEALGLHAQYAGAPQPEHYRLLLKQVLDDIGAELQSGRYGGMLVDFWAAEEGPFRGAKPMSSLRDVDEGGTIRGDLHRRTANNRPILFGHTRAAMDFITKRLIAGRRAVADAVETAPEGGG